MVKAPVLQDGIGRLQDVIRELVNLPNDESHVGDALQTIGSNLTFVAGTLPDRHYDIVIACAVLNQYFRKSGWLFRADDDGRFDVSFHPTDKVRDLIADLIGLPKVADK